MDVGAIGSGPGGANLSGVAGSVPAQALGKAFASAVAAEALGDSVATLFNDLSAPDIAKLTGIIEHALPPQDAALLQNILQAFLAAAAENDVTRALGALNEVVALDPARADGLRANPAVEPIRTAVDQFLDRHTALAKLDADARLSQAGQLSDSGAIDRMRDWDMPPATLIAIAGRLFESGGLANYVHSAQLAQLVIDNARWVPADVPVPAAPMGKERAVGTRPPARIRARLKTLWTRAPLLVMLLAWLAIGIVGGVVSMLWRRFSPETWPGSLAGLGFDVWGTGFIVLVLLGFWARVRKLRA